MQGNSENVQFCEVCPEVSCILSMMFAQPSPPTPTRCKHANPKVSSPQRPKRRWIPSDELHSYSMPSSIEEVSVQLANCPTLSNAKQIEERASQLYKRRNKPANLSMSPLNLFADKVGATDYPFTERRNQTSNIDEFNQQGFGVHFSKIFPCKGLLLKQLQNQHSVGDNRWRCCDAAT